MESKPVRFMPHALNSPEVQARIAEGGADALARTERINERLKPHIRGFNERISQLVRNQRNADFCVPAFWAIVDEMTAVNGDDVACQRGCNHCCHVQVLMTQDEAEVIGKRIGRKPRQPSKFNGRKDVETFDWGYHNPCTFLVDGECSIYENRPMPCRIHYSVDVDALMCELTPPESKAVPLLNPQPFIMAFLQMLGMPEVVPVLGDIREFFPRGKS